MPKEVYRQEEEIPPEKTQEGFIGNAAALAQGLPIVSHLSEMPITHTLRWLLWLMVIFISVVGLGLSAIGTMAGFVALGTLSSSLNAPVASASAALTDMSGVLSSSSSAGSNVADGIASSASSIRNLSAGLSETSSTLKALTSIPVIGAGLGGLNSASAKIDLASAEMGTSADRIDIAAASARDAGAKLGAVGADLQNTASGLEAARKGIAGAMLILQIACIAFGAAIMLMLSSTLMLALVVGPPQKPLEQKE